MANTYPGPLAPEELDRVNGYWGVTPAAPTASVPGYAGQPGVNMSEAWAANDVPPVTPPPPPPPPPNPSGWSSGDVDPYAQKTAAGVLAPPPAPAAPAKPVDTAALTPEQQAEADKEWKAFNYYESTKKKPAAKAGPAGPDRVRDAEKEVIGTYDKRKQAMEWSAGLQGDRADVMQQGMAKLAEEKRVDAEINKHEADTAEADFARRQGEIDRQIDEVRERKINPARLLQGDGMGTLAVIGGVLGGLYMGLNKLGSNPFMDDLNKQIDRDVRAQEKDIDTDHQGVVDKRNSLRDQRDLFKDMNVAKLQQRNLYYEATKQALEAEAAKYDSPIAQANAREAILAMEHEQSKFRLGIEKEHRAQAAAFGAAQANQLRELEKERRATQAGLLKEMIQQGMPPAQAEAESARQTAIIYDRGAPARAAGAQGPAGAPTDLLAGVPKSQQTKAAEELESMGQKEAGKADFDRIAAEAAKKLADPVWRAESAIPGTTAANEKLKMNAVIHQRMTGKGLASENDADKAITPFFVKSTNNAEEIKDSMARAYQAFSARHPTPILDHYSSAPKAPAKVERKPMP